MSPKVQSRMMTPSNPKINCSAISVQGEKEDSKLENGLIEVLTKAPKIIRPKTTTTTLCPWLVDDSGIMENNILADDDFPPVIASKLNSRNELILQLLGMTISRERHQRSRRMIVKRNTRCHVDERVSTKNLCERFENNLQIVCPRSLLHEENKNIFSQKCHNIHLDNHSQYCSVTTNYAIKSNPSSQTVLIPSTNKSVCQKTHYFKSQHTKNLDKVNPQRVQTNFTRNISNSAHYRLLRSNIDNLSNISIPSVPNADRCLAQQTSHIRLSDPDPVIVKETALILRMIGDEMESRGQQHQMNPTLRFISTTIQELSWWRFNKRFSVPTYPKISSPNSGKTVFSYTFLNQLLIGVALTVITGDG